jgi:2-enoate reductase
MSSQEDFIKDLLESFVTYFEEGRQAQEAGLTNRYHPYTRLFSPIQVNRLRIKNRLVMGPMGNISMAEEMGRPSNKMIQYFAARARGGVGLITSGLVPVSQKVDPTTTEPGDRSYFPRIDSSRTVMAGWRTLAESVHAFGSRFFIQLTPGLGRVGSPQVLLTKFRLPVSASWNPNFYLPEVPCRPLTYVELRRIIKATGQAAADAKSLTIDGVYLHGHEGYLLEQMTNTAFNRRPLGRYADWQRFGLDLIRQIRKRVGPNYPIMYRIDLSLALNATYGEKMTRVRSLKKFRNERQVAETLDYMTNLVRAGVDIFDVDLGCYDNWWLPHPPNSLPSGCYLPVAKLVKDFFAHQDLRSNAGLPVPVVAVGKLGYPDLAEKALRDEQCDMIMLARPLLADPDWPNKAFAGRVKAITPCIGDQEGCLNEFIEGGQPQCAVNPRTGLEDIHPNLAPINKTGNLAVVGAGPAGITCALTAARRGHRVSLFEQTAQIGGMLVPGSRPKIKYEVANYLENLRWQIDQAQKEHALEVQLSTCATPEQLKAEGFDAIITATGGQPVQPPIPGLDAPHVVQAVDLFRDPERSRGARHILVVGGGAVGCECAHFLAAEYGRQITLIEMLPALMKGLCTANRGHLIQELQRLKVSLMTMTRLVQVQEFAVTVQQNIHPSVPNPTVTWRPLLPENIENPFGRKIQETWMEKTLPADLVVLAVGLSPDDSLHRACIQAQAAPRVLNIGDSFQIGRVFEAVKAGFSVGNAI